MRLLSRIITYLFHPLLIPVFGTFFYFKVTPKYSPLEMQAALVLPVFILSVIIPIISLLILKNLGLVRTRQMLRAEERVYPLLIGVVLLLMILLRIIPGRDAPELYFFFLGMVVAGTASLMLALVGRLVSLHMVGMGSLLMFMISLSIHFEKNIIAAISLCTLVTGFVAMSRLYLRAQGRASIAVGWGIGVLSQLILLQLWI